MARDVIRRPRRSPLPGEPSIRTLRGGRGAAVLLAATLLAPPVPGLPASDAAPPGPDLQRHLDAEEVEGCFVLYSAGGDPLVRLHPERADRRYVPASTFKILNSLIALETGVLEDEHQVIPWDGKKRWLEKWNRDMDLADAYALSAVWFYQEVARRVGLERMARWVSAAGYGNARIGGQVDTFWLEGPLMISPEEQIVFLRRLHRGDLPFSERSMRIVREIMLLEQGPGYAVRGKTGWARRRGRHTGWIVGWVEREGDPRFFALNIESHAGDFPMFQVRRRILRGMLLDLGLIPAARPAGSRL